MAQRHSEQDLSHVQNPMLWVNWQAYLGKDFDTLPHALLCHFCPRTCSKYQHPPASLSTAKASFTVFFSKPLASQNKGRKEGRKEGRKPSPPAEDLVATFVRAPTRSQALE